MIYRIAITPNAEEDLRSAFTFINQQFPTAASKWIRGIRRAIKSLARNPERCSLAPESSVFDTHIRELFYGRSGRVTYRILFFIDGTMVYILHVRHGSMDVLR